MCQINYVDEFNTFIRYARNNQLTGRERLLWTALFAIANERAIYNPVTQSYDWPTGFFAVPNGELSLNSTLDKRGIESVRNSLKQRGILDFKKGSGNTRPAEYKIHYLSLDIRYKNVPDYVPMNVPMNAPGYVPMNVPMNAPGSAEVGYKNAPIFINNKYKLNTGININNYSAADGDSAGAESAVDSYLHWAGLNLTEYNGMDAAAQKAIGQITRRLFAAFCGREPTSPDEAYVFQALRTLSADQGTPYDENCVQLLSYAFDAAAARGCSGDWNYINGVVKNLYCRGIRTLADAEDYDAGA